MNIELFKKEEITKSDINYATDQIIKKLDDGTVHPMLLRQHIKAMEEIIENTKAALTKALVKEADKYPEKTFNLFGAEFTKAEAGVKYDFSGCGDPVWMRLNAEAEAAKEALKDRENFLKAIKGHETVVDEATGEIVKVMAPVKKSTSIIQCSIK